MLKTVFYLLLLQVMSIQIQAQVIQTTEGNVLCKGVFTDLLQATCGTRQRVKNYKVSQCRRL